MKRAVLCGLCSLTAVLSAPSVALAAGDDASANVTLPFLLLGAVGLAVAFVLLLQALAVRRLALGGVLGDRISYVVLAVLCLTASVLLSWIRNFVPAVTRSQVLFGSQALVIVAMVLLALYFRKVKSVLRGYAETLFSADSTDATTPAGE